MADTQKQKHVKVLAQMWSNWCGLDPQSRTKVAHKLGAVGHVLSIAANVHQFVNHSQSSTPSVDAVEDEEDEDIIDVEFEECP